jgi:hypothetical protein
VIEGHHIPVGLRSMTGIAIGLGGDMTSGFARGGHPVMAALAGTSDRTVVKLNAGPDTGRDMATVTLTGGTDM